MMPWWGWLILAVFTLLVIDNAIANVCNALIRRRDVT